MCSLPRPSKFAHHWLLDPGVVFLNHGSFGACPAPVLERQRQLRDQLERQPLRFFVRSLPALLDQARRRAARFLGAAPRDLAFVPNATAGVNAVLRSLRLSPGDQLLTTDHAYNACKNALRFVARRAGAELQVVSVPFAASSAEQLQQALLERVGPRTVLVLLDHVTSPTGLILPVEPLVRQLRRRGVETLVDGAHAPGMVPLELDRLGAAYYTGNFHKWVCAPKGAAFLHVRRDLQQGVRPLSISHGANAPPGPRSRFLQEFDWTGTDDPTPYLCVPTALEFGEQLLSGGWSELRQRNRRLCLRARELLCRALALEPPCSEELIGSLASIPLPDGQLRVADATATDPLQDRLLFEHQIEVQVYPWPAPPRRLLRISAQIYNSEEQYRYLARVLGEIPL